MLCGDTGKERSRVLVTGPRVFPFFFFFLPQYVFAFRCLGKTMCGFGSFSHWSMFWPRWLSAPRSTTWDASRWVSATTKLFCGCFLFEPLQVTSVAFGRTVRPVLWPALVWGYPFLSLTWSFSWALKSLLLLLPRQWESAGPICCLLCCAPEGWARWGEGREGLLGSLVHVLCLQMFLLPLLLLSASDGPDSGNWQQLPFFEMIEQWWRSWGCMDVCGRWARVPPWDWLLRIEVCLPAVLLGHAPCQEGDGIAQKSPDPNTGVLLNSAFVTKEGPLHARTRVCLSSLLLMALQRRFCSDFYLFSVVGALCVLLF